MREDRLFDCLHFARDCSDDSGFLYSADSVDRMVSELRKFGEFDSRGYPAGKIIGQLVWKKRGNKNWHRV
jgi:hypothetical protein